MKRPSPMEPVFRRGSPAFTLVELLVAVALMTIFLTMVATVFTQSQGAFSKARASVAMSQEARAVFDIMQRDLQAAMLVTYYDTSGDRQLGYFSADDGTHVGNDPPGPVNPTATSQPSPADMPKLYFVTNSQQVAEVSTVENRAEPFYVAYKMVWTGKNKLRVRADGTEDPTPANRRRGVFRLERRIIKAHDVSYESDSNYDYGNLDPTAFGVDGGDADAAPMAFNVLWMEYRFFNKQKNEWTTDGDWGTWDTSGETQPYQLPLAVQVKLVLTDPELRDEAVYTTQFFVPTAAE